MARLHSAVCTESTHLPISVRENFLPDTGYLTRMSPGRLDSGGGISEKAVARIIVPATAFYTAFRRSTVGSPLENWQEEVIVQFFQVQVIHVIIFCPLCRRERLSTAGLYTGDEAGR